MTGKIAVPIVEHGAGTPVLLLHGGTGPRSVANLAAHLADRHHVLVPTHPGWDGVTRPAEIDSAAALARVYLDVLAERGATDVTVIGSSFGGWVATEMALQDAEHAAGTPRISRLVTIDGLGPAVPGVEVPPFRPVAPAADGATAQWEFADEMRSALAAYLGRGLTDPAMTARVAELRLPTLVVSGAEDDVVPIEYGRGLAGLIPGATFAAIDGAGHMPHLQRPEETFRAVDGALAA